MPTRLAALTAAVLSLLACTPTTTDAVPMTNPSPPPATSRDARKAQIAMAPLEPAATLTGVVMTAPPRYLVGSAHAAFPGMATLPDGTHELVWRQGSDHYVARDGAILATTLNPAGADPAPATTLLSGGTDYRDPSISLIDGHEYLTYFTGSAANPGEGAFVTVDGEPPVRIDSGLAVAAVTAPVVKQPDGRLAVPFYGRKPGETKDTAFIAWSTNHGQTWTSNRMLNPATEATPEPWMVVDGNRVLYFARWGSTSLAVKVSNDGGFTWPTAPYKLSQAGMTGRPTVHRTASGVLILVYREVGTKAARLAYSVDHGATWVIGQTLFTPPAGSPLGMTYAAMVDVPGPVPLVRVVIGMEKADGSSALYGTYLAVSVQ